MTIFRILQPHELTQAAQLSDAVFRPNISPSMAEMFPPLFAPGIVHSYGAFAEDGTLAAFMGLAPSRLRVGGVASIRAFSIGSVCTSPHHRGAGLAGNLLELSIAHAKQAQAPLLLISGDRSLYTRAGSAAFGRATRFALRPRLPESSASGASSSPLTIRAMIPQDLQRIHTLHEASPTRFEESVTGLGSRLGAAAYAAVLGNQPLTLVAEDHSGIVAYAALAVPENRHASTNPATVVSYGGAPRDVAALLAAASETFDLSHLQIDVPWQDQELQAILRQPYNEEEQVHNGGTLLITDLRILLDQASDLWSLSWEEALQIDDTGKVFATSSRRELQSTEVYGILFDHTYTRQSDIPSWFESIPLPSTYGLHYI
ncbi:GNAT family N-acetyltransferase [Saccharibacillus sp. JS10]|uniref:GNAT family N-acetyltransferase n=1 Tax=Saccharibacillus sp. JS10 TaxID=2950552 RepID=UPI002108DC45|nr:GNAT family N-acetyltransferase [Saccharibacillus sp. JS10]MCQ4086628.1 GNAT family N-acetyltransferase [Saccharibacillus sp. JS10]